MKTSPPGWMTRFFRWYCRPDLVDGIEGDMYELFQRRVQKYGKRRASLLYLFNTITFFQPFAIRKRRQRQKINSMDMFRNYFKIASRSLLKTKSVSFINILGLAIGISSFIMMIAYVHSELSFDRFHSKADRIVRAVYSYEARGETKSISRVSFPLKFHMLENYPDVEQVVRFYKNSMDATTLKYEDQLFTEEDIFFTDPEVFEVFDFELVSGNAETALSLKNSIVLTEGAAKKYFGSENPLGKTILYKNADQLQVTAIVKKPKKSHIDFDFLVPVELQRQRWLGDASNNGYDLEKDWKWSGAWTYVLLKSPEAIASFTEQFHEDGIDLFGRVKETRVDFHFSAQPLLDIHLNSDLVAEIGANGNIDQVYGFAVVAFLILIIACLNFINLTTAQSTNRAKEIGLRKVMGAHRINLVWQFITESVLVTVLGTLLGLGLLELMVPAFNEFMDQQITIPYVQVPILMLIIVIGAIVVGGLAGAYPSLYLSKLRPVKTLKGNYHGDRSNALLRRAFVIGQFIISNVLIIGIIVVQLQMEFLKGKDLGFDKEQTIVLQHGSKLDEKFEILRGRLLEDPRVEGVSRGYVAGRKDWVQSFNVEGEALEEAKSLGFKNVGYDFLRVFDLEMVSGRYFSKEFPTDSASAVLINEAAVRTFGWTNEEALGKNFSWVGGSDNRTRFDTKVVGVMKDANFESLYEPVQPSVFRLSFWGDVAIKYQASNTSELLAAVEQTEDLWYELMPSWPFEFSFLDEQIEEQYLKEERLGQMVQFFAFLAIFIACMGLFGLASFSVKKRTKEIGIRKVLGAGVAGIITVIMKGFILLVLFSVFISVPVGYYLSNAWLQNFAYRIQLSPLIFVTAGLVSAFIAALAIFSQSLQAAKADPVNTLKYE